MTKGRRVGTFTAGISLMVFGILFLLRIFIPQIDLLVIAPLWPLVLIFLGAEILVSYILNREEMLRYDFGSVVLILLLLLGTFALAAGETLLQHVPSVLSGLI